MFLNDLVTKQLPSGKWELMQEFKYASPLLDRVITVPAGFITDYASVPRLPFVYAVFGGVANKAAVIHDWLYTNQQHPDSTPDSPITINRKTADNVFEEAVKCELPRWKAALMWLGVRIGGSEYWRT